MTVDSCISSNINKEGQLDSLLMLKTKACKALSTCKDIELKKLESGLYEYVQLDARTKVLRKNNNYDK